MADLQDENINLKSCGYDSRLFVDKNSATTYQCGICHNVCKNAVEITEKKSEFETTNNNLDRIEETLFCYECIAQSNLSQSSYHPSKFIRNVINNLIVLCPYSIDFIGDNNNEGNNLQTQCQWEGTLLDLQSHMETECVRKPFSKCPFDCNYTNGQIIRNHFNEYQTEHINILLSMVQSLTNQLSMCQNQIVDLQHQIHANKQQHETEINTLKQQTISMSCTNVPPPPPPPSVISNTKTNCKNKKHAHQSHNSHLRIRRPIDSIGSDFKFQLDHPNISVIANGRTALCVETKDILIEFGECLIKHKPSRKSRDRRRDSSVDEFFADPLTLKKKHSVIVLNDMNEYKSDYEHDQDNKYEIKTDMEMEMGKTSINKMRRSFSNPFKRNHNRKHKKSNSEILKFEKDNMFAMSKNDLREYNKSLSVRISSNDYNLEKIKCWECYISIEECNEFGNIGIAMIKDTNDGIAVVYKNGDYIDLHKNKTNKKGFKFQKGNIIKISMVWKGVKCFVSILNMDSNVSVIIDKFDMWINIGFILNQSRISVIEQYWM